MSARSLPELCLLSLLGDKSPYHSLTPEKAKEKRMLVIMPDCNNAVVADCCKGSIIAA